MKILPFLRYHFLVGLFLFSTLSFAQQYEVVIPIEHRDFYVKGLAGYSVHAPHYYLEASRTHYAMKHPNTKTWTLHNWSGDTLLTLHNVSTIDLTPNFILYSKTFTNETEYQNYLKHGENDLPIPPPGPRSIYKVGVLDLAGNTVIPLEYDGWSISDKSQDVAALKKGNYWHIAHFKTAKIHKVNVEQPKRFDMAKDFVAVRKEQYFGMFDFNNDLLFEDLLMPEGRNYWVSGNFVVQYNLEDDAPKDHIGKGVNRLINKHGKMIAEDKFRAVRNCGDEHCVVNKVYYDSLYETTLFTRVGILNATGEYVLPVKNKDLTPLGDNFYRYWATFIDPNNTSYSEDTYGILDAEFKEVEVVRPRYIRKRVGKYWQAEHAAFGNKTVLVNDEGKPVFGTTFRELSHIIGPYFLVTQGMNRGVIKFPDYN